MLAEYDSMGIPDFQRGLVWERSTVALLLESLYLNTPCGSIILWTSPVGSSRRKANAARKYMIVDGQQRIRSLHDVFDPPNAETEAGQPLVERLAANPDVDEREQSAGDSRATWCVNLGAMPEFQETFRGGKRFALFRRVRDPRSHGVQWDGQRVAQGAPLQDREALLPLKWFLDHGDDQIRRFALMPENSEIAKAALAILGNEPVKQRLRGMRTNHVFQVSILGADRSLRDAIGIYNRINTAGTHASVRREGSESVGPASLPIHPAHLGKAAVGPQPGG